jgi:hypothetical protein
LGEENAHVTSPSGSDQCRKSRLAKPCRPSHE